MKKPPGAKSIPVVKGNLRFPLDNTYHEYTSSNHFEKLSGKLKGKCSIQVNDQWRLVFVWNDEHGEAEGLYLDDHSYK